MEIGKRKREREPGSRSTEFGGRAKYGTAVVHRFYLAGILHLVVPRLLPGMMQGVLHLVLRYLQRTKGKFFHSGVATQCGIYSTLCQERRRLFASPLDVPCNTVETCRPLRTVSAHEMEGGHASLVFSVGNSTSLVLHLRRK